VSRHVQSTTGSEKIIALSSIYGESLRGISSRATPSSTKVYFPTPSQEGPFGPKREPFPKDCFPDCGEERD